MGTRSHLSIKLKAESGLKFWESAHPYSTAVEAAASQCRRQGDLVMRGLLQ